MIPVVDRPEVTNSDAPLHRIDMRQMDAEDIQTMLEQSRDGFYSNKELAPLREYSTNARDSHVRKGIPNTPIQVTLPTVIEPELKIRDFGTGLTLEAITDVYFKYWKSTKRFTNDENGCLGIGSKSAFSYTGIYTVTSWCEGMKTVVTGQKSGFADVIFREPKNENDPDGVEVTIPVLQKDIEKFKLEAMKFFQYWDIRPDFKGVTDEDLKRGFHIMDTKPFLSGEGWALRPGGNESDSVAYMGNVPYSIDWYQVKNSLDPVVNAKINGIFSFLEGNVTVLYFPNGTLSFTPNRESLQYNDATVKYISDKLVTIYDVLLETIMSKISTATNLWEAKIIYNTIFKPDVTDSNDISLGGNLTSIEILLRNRIVWNNIVIRNGFFSDLHYWDKHSGKCMSSRGNSYLAKYFYKKGTETKVARTTKKKNHDMLASKNTIVVIQDTEKNSYAKTAAEYYFENTSNLNKVYVLDLSEKTVKEEFFTYYNFDTVPVVYISKIESTLIAFAKSHRKSKPTTGGGSNNNNSAPTYTGTPLNYPYIEIKDRRCSKDYVETFNQTTGNVDICTLTNGVFIETSYGSLTVNGEKLYGSTANDVIQSIYEICKITGQTLDKVYAIPERTTNSQWFKKAIKAGTWVNITDFVKKVINQFDSDTIKKSWCFSVNNDNLIGSVTANQLLPKLKNYDSPGYKYCQLVGGEIAHNKYIQKVILNFGLADYIPDKTNTLHEFVKTLNKEIKVTYPLIARHVNSGVIQSSDICPTKSTTKTGLDDRELNEIPDYINLVDSCLTN